MTEATAPAAPKPTGLALLRQQVDDKYIAKLPKPTKQQTEAVRADFKNGKRCNLCGTWHHPDVVHLDYVGHAATTARLLEADERWNWEPLCFTEAGLPKLDETGGLWIKLTVAGTTRLGYGHADVKPNADNGARIKEAIGDAIRNAAMRFGWALELWHKGGDLFLPTVHEDDDGGSGAGAGGSERAGEGGQRGEQAQQHPPETTGEPATKAVPKKLDHAVKPNYSKADFEKNLPAWRDLIESGKKTAAAVIATLESKATLTAQQRAEIKKAKAK